MEKLRGIKQPSVGYVLPKNTFNSVSVAPVEPAPLEAVFIFFDTATYNEIERDVKVTKDTVTITVPAFGICTLQRIRGMTEAEMR